MYLDPYAFAESNFIAGNNPAESPRGGLVFNMVTKTGTNQLHGGAMFSGANRSMGFDNFSDELRSQLLSTLSPAVLAINPQDQAARLYQQRCHRFIREGLPRDWNGVTLLDQK